MKKTVFTLIITTIIAISGYSQSPLKNSIGVHLGLVAWDGSYADFLDFYELQYIYQLSNRIGIVGKFNSGGRNIKMSNSGYISNEEEFFNSKFINKNNTSKNPAIIYSQYHSVGIGIKYRINHDVKSSIQLYLGTRQVYINEKSFSSSGSRLEYYADSYEHKVKLGFELGISYEYKLTDIVSLSSSAHFVSNAFLWEINLGGNIWF